ncbi:MAG: ATP-dependent zinc metalloprotease FtsH [Oceanicaulis sp.]
MNMRNILVWAILLVLLLALFNMLQGPSQPPASNEINYSSFMDQVEAGQVDEVTIQGDTITGTTTAGTSFRTTVPADANVTAALRQNEVDITARQDDSGGMSLLSILIGWFPMLLLIGVWIFFMRQMQGGGRGAMGFGKSKAKLLTEKTGKVTFDDVAGVDEAKEELQEVVEFLKDPSKFQRLGGKIPKGALLVGPPGTGKTLIARAVAGEAGVPFFTISGSDFVEMFVGVGASRVRDMFEQAKKNAPCIIFIDEIDAVGRSRGAGLGGGNDDGEQSLDRRLGVEDGFESIEVISLFAATTRPGVRDPALLRPGRFDRQVTVPNPDVTGREKILKVHMRDVPLGDDVSPHVIARGTPGFSGADLANLVNEAALMAARRNKRLVGMAEFEDAKDKVMMGPERRSMVMTEKEKTLTAYHEAGHALVALKVPAADPVHKATIIPRGRALGMVMQLPEGDKMSMTYEEMTSRLAIMMGGRVAEELKFGREKVTSGAASDIQQATRLARAMVTRWGFSEEIGPVDYGEDQGDVFLGQQLMQSSKISAETASKIEREVKALVEGGLAEARRILTEYNEEWEALSQGLLEYETLTGEEIKALLRGETPTRDTSVPPKSDDKTPPSGAVPVIDDEDEAPSGGLAPKPGGA